MIVMGNTKTVRARLLRCFQWACSRFRVGMSRGEVWEVKFFSYIATMYDLKADDGLASFDRHLENFAYASGYTPSGDDVQLFKSLNSEPPKKYANISRWYRNIGSFSDEEQKSWPSPMTSANGDLEKKELDEDIDLFGSDDEDDGEKARITAARLKAYEEKKAKKPATVAKSNIIFDVKPWDDSIEIADIEKNIRTIELDGLVWGAAKVLPVAYGIKKLQICCVVEDEKVSSDWLEEQIMAFDELVQSVDIVAFNKLVDKALMCLTIGSSGNLTCRCWRDFQWNDPTTAIINSLFLKSGIECVHAKFYCHLERIILTKSSHCLASFFYQDE
ncbi:Elongation factor 1-beta [Dirofilaria immitis]